MIKKFKLVKSFPCSPEVGTIYIQYGHWFTRPDMFGITKSYRLEEVESSPEFFAPFLFTTEDGVDMYIGDTYYLARNGFVRDIEISADWTQLNKVETTDCKRFSTKEAATKYLNELNKPKFEKGEWICFNSPNYYGIFRFIGDDGSSSYDATESYWWSRECENIEINTGAFSKSYCSKATPEQIQDVLSKVAISKGFKEGVKFKSAWSGDLQQMTKTQFRWDDGLFTHSVNTGYVYYKGKWAEIVEDTVPKYIECIKQGESYFQPGIIYQVVDSSNLSSAKLITNVKVRDKYAIEYKAGSSLWTGVKKDNWKPSTKAKYDAQFQKELTITLDGDVVNTSYWGNNVKITYK